MKNPSSLREHYLKKFRAENRLDDIFPESADVINKTGHQIVEIIKKEDLTYEQAYASLQYAYNLLKYQSNFVKIPKD